MKIISREQGATRYVFIVELTDDEVKLFDEHKLMDACDGGSSHFGGNVEPLPGAVTPNWYRVTVYKE